MGRCETGRYPGRLRPLGEVIVRGCPQPLSPLSTWWHVQISHLMLVYLVESTTAVYAAATTQGPKQASRASTGPKNQQHIHICVLSSHAAPWYVQEQPCLYAGTLYTRCLKPSSGIGKHCVDHGKHGRLRVVVLHAPDHANVHACVYVSI